MSDSAEQSRRVIVERTDEEAARTCARLFREMASQAVERHGVFALALAGGTTPHPLYERLARDAASGRVPWGEIQIFFGDERDVPQDHVESNYNMAQRTLLDHVPVPLDRVHPMPADAEDLASAAADYERIIREVVPAGPGGVPAFDLILLGMGGDGHVASLFPQSTALSENRELVTTHFVPVLGRNRMTFTYRLLNAARDIMFLVTGEDKAEAVEQLFSGQANPMDLPAAGVAPVEGRTTFVLDVLAARRAGLRPA